MAERFYVTTPIYYVNGLPHIGHAYTTIAADTAARWHRLLGESVLFLTGTDEHGSKVAETAKKRGLEPIAHCDDMLVHWKQMMARLDIQYDRFIRTTDPDHVAVVRASLQKLHDAGLLYKASYSGWYHVGDEAFVTEKDIQEGRYDKADLQQITESNWFFKMSAYQEALVARLESDPLAIRPESRRNEVLGFLRRPLGDLCITRPKARLSWGIEIPFDTDFVTYVWFDALLNYLTGTGWHPDRPGSGDAWWPADVQLLGKDILTTHAVYWGAMLLALEVPLPKTLYAHGWWVAADGAKMSKSLGNAIDVSLLLDAYGVDATRYFLLREVAFGQDGAFSYDGFMVRYNADLANDLGNLAHRTLTMASNWLGGLVPAHAEVAAADVALRRVAARAVTAFAGAMNDLQFHDALAALWELVRAGNKYVDTEAPWALNKAGRTARLATVMRHVFEACAVVGALLQCVIPGKSKELLGKLGLVDVDVPRLVAGAATGELAFDLLTAGTALNLGEPLFPRIKEQPPAVAELLARIAAARAEEAAREAETAALSPPKATPAAVVGIIQFEDFAKVQLRAGKIVSAERHPKADNLLVLGVDVGEGRIRSIVAGIASRYSPESLPGTSVVAVINLEPKKLRGVLSEGMLLAAGAESVVGLVSVDAPPGTVVR